MHGLNEILTQAAAAIGREYFLLPMVGTDPVYRAGLLL